MEVNITADIDIQSEAEAMNLCVECKCKITQDRGRDEPPINECSLTLGDEKDCCHIDEIKEQYSNEIQDMGLKVLNYN